jgi:cobalt-zinc-cadmium efflux system membrane fusion protein
MSGKSIVLVVVAALFGSLASAAAMRYAQPIGHMVMTAPTGIPFLDEPAGVKPGGSPERAEIRAAHTKPDDGKGHDHEKSGEHTDHDHKGEAAHKADGHQGHEDHKDGPNEAHGEDPAIQLSEADQREFGIAVETAGSGALHMHVNVPGKVALNADHQAHIVPRVSGVVQAVHKTLGDQVRAGEILATLESRELADLKSAYLTAQEQQALAQSVFDREADLRQKKITSEQEYLQAKQDLASAKIATRAAAQKLRALGLSDEAITRLPTQPGATFTQYAITAPFNGTIIERHISLGEVLQDATAAFVVADLSTVWVDLQIYPKDLPFVRTGQTAVMSADPGIPEAQGTIAYMGPVVGEQTRTALARVVLPNPQGHWRPGLFVTADITIERHEVSLLIPETALQSVEERPTVFVETPEGFIPQPVTLGRRNAAAIEVTSGLVPGQRYVTRGAFTLKAQLAKGSFGDGHNH